MKLAGRSAELLGAEILGDNVALRSQDNTAVGVNFSSRLRFLACLLLVIAN